MNTEMNKATLRKFTDKMALVAITRNAFELGGTIGYIAKEPVKDLEEGAVFDIPAGWRVEQHTDENGDVMSTKDGEPLSFFHW